MTRWTRLDSPVSPGGDIGGDVQSTESYSVHWRPVEEPADGDHALVTATFYGVHVEGQHFVEAQIEFLICEDPRDPGGSEVWSQVLHQTWPEALGSVEQADQAAMVLALGVTGGIASGWDGRSEIDFRQAAVG